MSLLSAKEQARLDSVREHLSNGSSPFSHITDHREPARSIKLHHSKSSIAKRLELWQSKDNGVNVRSKNGRIIHSFKTPIVTETLGFTCIVCGSPIDYITSVKGTVLKGMKEGTKTELTPSGEVVEVVNYIPLLRTGRACFGCEGSLDEVQFDESEG